MLCLWNIGTCGCSGIRSCIDDIGGFSFVGFISYIYEVLEYLVSWDLQIYIYI